MKLSILRLVKRIPLIILLFTALQMQSLAQGFSPITLTRLQFVLDSFQNDPANPYVGGMSAAINVDGLASWQGATGFAARNVDAQNNLLPGGTPFTTSMVSRMYSVTKTFTASLVLELAKRGVFSLDNTISQFLPLNLINPSLNGSVTIRQLLVHESGYSDYTDEMQLQIAVAFQPMHSWTAPEILSFIHQIAAPGAERRYSSSNYIALGAIIEITTQKPVEQHFRERFFNPLQLRSMSFAEREPLRPGAVLVAPHENISAFNPIFQLTGQPTFPDAYTNISAFPYTAIASAAFTGGAIITNVADMAKWGNDLYGGRATSRSVLEQMLNSISPTPDEDGDYLGYGIIRSTKISATDIFIGHDGTGPGYRAVMFYNPDRKMTIAILTNYHGAKIYDVAKALFESLPDFTCERRNHDDHNDDKHQREDKVLVCLNGHPVCVDRNAAATLISHGAYLGGCSHHHHQQMDADTDTDTDLKIRPTTEAKIPVADHAVINVYPNPFNNQFTATFQTKTSGKVNFVLYDITGKPVATMFNGFAEKGIQQKVELKTGNLSAGTYFARLQTPDGIQQQKIVLTR